MPEDTNETNALVSQGEAQTAAMEWPWRRLATMPSAKGRAFMGLIS
jgi:hypothetical protein